MHPSQNHRAPQRTLSVALALLALLAVGCPKQENFPAAIEAIVPPTPSTFVITLVNAEIDPPKYDYDFSWTVSDPSDIDRYRVYLLGGGFVPNQVLFETPSTTYPTTLGYSLANLQFAVTAISTDGVEGEGRVAIAP